MSQNINNFLPKWTKKIKIDGGGRDPLGLSKLSGALVDNLLAGITTTTSRARYYSFYTWCLLNIDNQLSNDEFTLEFRKRESFMALCTFSLSKELNYKSKIVGIERVKDNYLLGKSEGLFDCNFKVLPSNELGGYGQYYKGSLENIGFIAHNHDVTEKGAELAEYFSQSVKNTPYIMKNLFQDSTIDLHDLEKSQKAFSLDSLLEPFASDELKLLKNCFFSDSNYNFYDYRKQTLTLILYTISEYEKNNIIVSLKGIDHYFVYHVYYYKTLFLVGSFIEYEVPKGTDIKNCFDLWHDFCLHQILIHAIEFLFCAVLETLEFKGNNLTLDEICNYLIENKFIEDLENAENPSNFLHILGFDSIPTKEQCLEMQKKYSPLNNNIKSEINIIYNNPPEYSKISFYTSNSIYLLVILYLKWRKIDDLEYVKTIVAGNNICVPNVLPFLDNLLFDPDVTWQDLLKKLIQRFVLDQHKAVFFEKKCPDSIWIKTSDDIVTKEKDYTPDFRATRHPSAISILNDLGLLQIIDSNIYLTNDGKNTLVELLEEESKNI